MNFEKFFLAAILFTCPRSSFCQQATKVASIFNPQELFAQDLFTKNGNEFRPAYGAPGPTYWQNRANYILKSIIDTIANLLTATETIQYTNNSPDALSSLWLQLDQSIYREDARSNFYSSNSLRSKSTGGEHTDGYQFDEVTIEYKGKIVKADYIISDTRMQIRLTSELLTKEKINIHIQYHYTISGIFGGRTDYFETKNGKIYEIAQWYPRMCVYDDQQG